MWTRLTSPPRVTIHPGRGGELKGWPVMTVVRGEVVMDNGEICGEKGFGKFIRAD